MDFNSATLNWQKTLDEYTEIFNSEKLIDKFYDLHLDLSNLINYIENSGNLKKFREKCDDILSKSFGRADKWNITADEWKQKGNDFFVRKKYEEAIDCYNKCLVYSEKSNWATIFSNRSAALFHLKKYKESLLDISLAINSIGSHDTPTTAYKWFHRKAQCLEKLETNAEECIEAAEKALDMVEKSDLNEKRKESMLDEIIQLKDRVKKKADGFSVSYIAEGFGGSLPEVEYGPNDVITQASAAVKLQFNKDQGRHLVAGKTLDIGDILIVEKPYASILLPDFHETHCYNCYKNVSLIQRIFCCETCYRIRFCSLRCQKISQPSHRYECCFQEILVSIGIAHLSLKIVVTAGYRFLMDFQKRYARRPADIVPGISEEDGKYDFGYLSVYDLMPHNGNMEALDLFQYSLTAYLLLKLLRKNGFFLANAEQSEIGIENLQICNDSELFIGSLLLRHILQLVCNAHAITGLVESSEMPGSHVTKVEQVRIATAIYPTSSLMNHSCDPTIISSFQNDVLCVRAAKHIKVGDEVYNCYGPNHCRMPRKERQSCLKSQYFFTCKCPPCSESPDGYETAQALACSKCEGAVISPDPKCKKCGNEEDVLKIIEKAFEAKRIFDEANTMLESSDIKGAVKLFKECLDRRLVIFYEFNQELAEVYDSLAYCYSVNGLFMEASNYLSEGVRIIEHLHGATSIELANELVKLSDVLLNAGLHQKAKKTVDDALRIFKLLYGENNSSVKELEDKKNYLDLVK